MRRIVSSVFLLMMFLASSSLAQVRIRENVSISPKPPNMVQSTSGGNISLMVTFSFTGSIRPDMPRFLRVTNCATDQFVDPMSTSATISIPARSGRNTTLARWSIPAGTSGTAKLKIELDGVILRQDTIAVSCFCTFQMNPEVFLQSGVKFTLPGSITHGQSAPIAMTNAPFTSCSNTVWHPLMRTTITITQGANLGSFYDESGNRLGTSATGNQFELSKVRFVADGDQPEGGKGTLTLEASSQGTTIGSTDVEIEASSTPPVIDSVTTATAKLRFPVGTAATLLGYFHDEDNDVIIADWSLKSGPAMSSASNSSPSSVSAASNAVNSPYSKSFSPVIGGLYMFQFVVADVALNTASKDLQLEFVELDHFTVQVAPDTIGYLEAATMRVIAKDNADNELDIDGNTLIRLSVDDSQFGSYVVNGTDTLRTKDLEVLYTWARSDRVRFVANKINPIILGPKTLNFTVVKAADHSKSGSASVTILEKATIKIEFAQRELRPLGDSDNKSNLDRSDTARPKVIDFSKVTPTTATVVVTDRFQKPVSNYPFTITASAREFSGGHDHTSDRPTGKLISGKDTLSVVQEVSDAAGKRQYTYLSSGFGGVDSLFVQGPTQNDTATATVVLAIPNLKLLEDGEHYDLIGQFGTGSVTSNHRVNHYGTSTLIDKIKALADSVFSDSSYVLGINDMSLVLGGPFDVHNNWNTPHESHRQGASADVDDFDSNKKKINSKYLQERVENVPFKGRILIHNDHFHLTFR